LKALCQQGERDVIPSHATSDLTFPLKNIIVNLNILALVESQGRLPEPDKQKGACQNHVE